MKIVVDWDLCQGHETCASEAPEVFRLDPKQNKVEVLVDRPDESLRAKVELAVRYCPTRALSIEES